MGHAKIEKKHGKLENKNARYRVPGDVRPRRSHLSQVRRADGAAHRHAHAERRLPVLGVRGVSGLPGEPAAEAERLKVKIGVGGLRRDVSSKRRFRDTFS
jgi:hypothetical protein